MDETTLIATLRAAHRTIPFEDPMRGAAVLSKLSHGLPASEALKQLSPAERAIAAVRRTIAHCDEARAIPDPSGHGARAIFRRRVTEGAARWDFEVEVAVDRDHHAAITEVRVDRTGDAPLDHAIAAPRARIEPEP